MKMRTVLALLLLSTVAFADDKKDEARLINFNAVLQLPDGGDIQECSKLSEPEAGKETGFTPVCLEKKSITLGMVVYRAMLKRKPNVTLNEDMAKYRLQRLVLKGPTRLSSADVTILVNAVHEFDGFSSEVAGQSICLLDPIYCVEKKD
jgi:hypothetical protein